jgi:hypothetical protein
MSDKLEAYLEEISHFLSGRAEREEILSEIRSHILEKAAVGAGAADEAAVERAIASYGPARTVAERYVDDRPIIAPAYKRYLFRYTSILFAAHAALTVFAVVFKEDFVLFPLLYLPKLGVLQALMYLPTAFLADLGIVAVVLYIITQRGKDVRLPWPKFGVDLDEIKPPRKLFWHRLGTGVGAVVMLALTDLALYVFSRYGTIFLFKRGAADFRPLLTPEAGRRVSLVIIGLFAVSTMALLVKLFTSSRWVDVVSRTASLGLIGLLLNQPLDAILAVPISEPAWRALKYTITFSLLFIALMTAIELVKSIVVLSRRRLRRAV